MTAHTALHDRPCPPEKLSAGIGLRHTHYNDVIETRPAIGWLEVHPENYFCGGAPRHALLQARALYPVSFHAVGMSLGSAERVSPAHLTRIKELVAIYEPFQISDHASWSMSGNAHLNDLLPLPYNEETLATLCRNIDETQNFLGRQILVENPSTYLAFKNSTMTEWEFMNETARRTGCGLLLDSNNIYVQSVNHGFDAFEYMRGIEGRFVKEMHLAGHLETVSPQGERILIDTHNSHICDDVWRLYDYALAQFGPVPTLIEWDQDLPPLSTLVAEAHKAETLLKRRQVHHDAA